MTSYIVDRTVGAQVTGLVPFNLTLLVIDGDHPRPQDLADIHFAASVVYVGDRRVSLPDVKIGQPRPAPRCSLPGRTSR